MLNLYDENENFYLIKAITQAGEKYVFNARTYLENIELAKHYSTLSSARRMAKAVQDEGYETKIISEKTGFRINCDVLIGTLYVIIGGNLSEERVSPAPPSKDF
jgi:hypothetical protein